MEENQSKERSTSRQSSVGGSVYGLGFLGALIYFIQTATSFWDGVGGFFKALFWPAYLVYYLFQSLML
jgi:hypothetical protein